MRVIGGNARGRRLKVPRGRSLRPTAARVKEALFDILPHDLSGLRVLDLFAGTGNVTIEALSRGAEAATLVDASVESGRAIRDNLRRLGLSDRAHLLIAPVERALRQLARRHETFELIFVDPPYGRRLVERTFKIIAQGDILCDSGVAVAEHGVRDHVADRFGELALRDRRRYGDTMLSFFEWQRVENSEARNPANGT
jgi:16S rRNA (guanine(966)-N(2))-methyltransferase RsmD